MTRQFVLLLCLGAAVSCDPFSASPVPLAEPGRSAQPLREGAYDFFVAPDASVPIQTGVYLTKAEGGYRTHYLSTARTTLSLAVFGAAMQADIAETQESWQPRSTVEALQEVEILIGLAGRILGRNDDGEWSDEQAAMLAEFAGFALSPLDSSYFVYQEPRTFLVSRWPRTDRKTSPSWTLKVARMDGDSMVIFKSANAAVRASEALFGTEPSCDTAGACRNVAKVTQFTDSPELNRQILVRTVRDFASELEFEARLVPRDPPARRRER